MSGKVILHIDMNSYFASVEQQANPFLRGRSVGVCAYLSPNGCILASSLEAKAKGIRTGCRVKEAQVLDPQIVLIENEPAKYRSVTERIFRILREYTDKVEPYSIDEAFLDLSGWVEDIEAGAKLGRIIQDRIKKEVGEWLNSSVGVSWTKFLAKFASDMAPKKGQLSITDRNDLQTALTGRSLTDAWGINRRMEGRLLDLGIADLQSLQRYDPQRIRYHLGRYGYYLWANVNGLELTQVMSGVKPPQSIGHSYCLPQKGRDKRYLAMTLYKLCEKTGRSLRAKGMEAGRVSLFLDYTVAGGLSQSFRTGSVFTTEEIYGYADSWLKKAELTAPVRMLMVAVSALRPVSAQMSFFEDRVGTRNLSLAMDRINDKYGEFTVMRGQMFGTGNMARDRIGFRKIEGLSEI